MVNFERNGTFIDLIYSVIMFVSYCCSELMDALPLLLFLIIYL